MELSKTIEEVLLTVESVQFKLSGSGSSEHATIILDLVNSFATLASVVHNQRNDQISLDEFNEKLNMLLGAYENQDWDLMVSVLQMEIRPLLEFWLENLVSR